MALEDFLPGNFMAIINLYQNNVVVIVVVVVVEVVI